MHRTRRGSKSARCGDVRTLLLMHDRYIPIRHLAFGRTDDTKADEFASPADLGGEWRAAAAERRF
jgi:hypothetical protein